MTFCHFSASNRWAVILDGKLRLLLALLYTSLIPVLLNHSIPFLVLAKLVPQLNSVIRCSPMISFASSENHPVITSLANMLLQLLKLAGVYCRMTVLIILYNRRFC